MMIQKAATKTTESGYYASVNSVVSVLLLGKARA